MQERKLASDRVKVETGILPMECFVNGIYDRTIKGFGVKVLLGHEVVWEKYEYPQFISYHLLHYMEKPLYARRIERAKNQADKFADKLRKNT